VEWKAVPGYRAYEVSSDGQVRSLDRVVGAKYTKHGKRSSRFIKGQVLTLRLRPDGTPCANLWRRADYEQVPVRRLMMLAFRGARPRGMDAVNSNGDVTDNRLENLKWAYPPNASAGTLRRLMGVS
jgi:hypothetical protein